MVKMIAVFAGAVICLSACAENGHSVLVRACADDGEPRENCVCMADIYETELTPEALAVIVLNAAGEDEAAEAAAMELELSDAMSIAGATMKAAETCGTGLP